MRKNKQWICIVMSLFILLSGMCLESIHADAVLLCAQKEESTFLNIYRSVPSMEARVEEISQESYTATIRRATGQSLQIRRTLRVVYELLCKVDTAGLSDKFYTTEEFLAAVWQEPGAVVTNYIHDSDGKKRI